MSKECKFCIPKILITKQYKLVSVHYPNGRPKGKPRRDYKLVEHKEVIYNDFGESCEITIHENMLHLDYNAYSCDSSFWDKLQINFCPMCGRNLNPCTEDNIGRKNMELQFKARIERSQIESLLKAEIKEHLATIDIQQLVKSSIDLAISKKLERHMEYRLNGGAFLENVVKHVQKRLAADVVLDKVLDTIDVAELQSQISKDIAAKLIKNYEQ